MKKVIAIFFVIFLAWMILGQLWFIRSENLKIVDKNLMTVVIDAEKGDRIELFQFEGKELYKVTRPSAVSIFNLASGSRIFIYDLRGHMVAWCSDVGDNPGFSQRWGGFLGAREISIEDVRQRNNRK